MTSNAEIEMRWVQAWSDLYEIVGKSSDIPRIMLPDGQFVDMEACKGWLQESVYQGWFVKVDERQDKGKRVFVASRWKTRIEIVHSLRIGMTREEVVRVLGQPDDTGGTSNKHKTPRIYKYCDIELHFTNGRNGLLWMVYKEDDAGNSVVLLQ